MPTMYKRTQHANGARHQRESTKQLPTAVTSEDASALRMGIDVGTTTVKLVVPAPGNEGQLMHVRYRRHDGEPVTTLAALLNEAASTFPGAAMRIGVTGSAGRAIADAMGVPYVREILAISMSLQTEENRWTPDSDAAAMLELVGGCRPDEAAPTRTSTTLWFVPESAWDADPQVVISFPELGEAMGVRAAA